MNQRQLGATFFRFFLIASLSAAVMYGQARSGAIYGTVTDATGAVVPGAAITVIDQATNRTRSLTTDAVGRYQVPLLPVGTYTVKAKLAGFRDAELKDLVLEIQDNREVNFTLVPAAVGESVTVTAELVETERATSSLGQVIHEQQVINLPLNGRNFVQLGTLVPGVVKGEGTFFNNRGNTEVSIRGSVSLSAQGMRENSNDWLLDGIDNNELTAGAVSILPSIDAIQEFKVMTYNYSAEYGSRGSTTVIVNTKSGSNAFHGTAFEFLRNDHLDARNFFDGAKKGKYNQNQFGASLGGPIRKDKTFFFGDWQGTRIRQGLTFLSQVPTARMRAGDFNESFPGAARRIIFNPKTTRTDPATGRTIRDPFPNNIIPSDQLDPIGVKLLDLFALPNLTDRLAGNYLSNPVKQFSNDPFNIRIDHGFSEKDALFLRYSHDDAFQFFPNGLPGYGSGPSGAFSTCTFDTNARNVAISETHTFSPRTINQFTAGFNRVFNRMISIGQGTNLAQKLGIPGANTGDYVTSGVINISFSGGYNRLGDRLFTPFQGGTNVFHYLDSLSHVRGAHTLKAGVNIRFMQMNTLGNTWPHGNFNFDNLFTAGFTAAGTLDGATGHPIASILMGLPTTGGRSDQFDGWIIGRRWREYRGYLEDTWKARPNLTLNLGLAYDVTTPHTEVANRGSNFDFATGKFLIPGVNTDDGAGVQTDTNNLQPRFGFAWSPRGSKSTTIRGGYGIFYDVSAVGGVQGLYQNPPFAFEYGFTSDNIAPVRTLATGFPVVQRPALDTYAGNIILTQLDYVQGLVQQWNLNVQRELPGSMVLTLAYAGTRGTHLQDKGFNLNTATPGPGSNPRARRPYPQYNNFNSILSRGDVNYQSFQVKGEKRMSHGFYYLLSYTWSKALTNGLSQNVGVGTGIKYFPLALSIAGKNADRAMADTDIRHSFTLSYLYDLPFGRGRVFLSNLQGVSQAILGNWQVNGITRLRTGFPLHPSMSVSQSGTAFGNRPDRTCDGTLDNPTPSKFFNTSCFVAPAAGVLGNSARSVLSGPGQVNFDFSVFKTFPIREGSDLQFRTEFFNIFNTAQFDFPGLAVGAANFGVLQATINSSRQVQFALKFRF